MSPHPVPHGGEWWRTAEALFQALRFHDEPLREEIRAAKSPMRAKMIARKNRSRMAVVPRGGQDLANMEAVLRLKLACHPGLRVKLLETGGAVIVEDCTRRPNGSGLFWGAAFRGGQWVGENTLGKLWMRVRDGLREGEDSV